MAHFREKGEKTMNKAEKSLIAVTLLVCIVYAFFLGYLSFQPRIQTISSHKVFIYDRESNTLYISGRTEDNLITWSEISRILMFVKAKPNYTIITNSTIVIDRSITAQELQRLLDSLKTEEKEG